MMELRSCSHAVAEEFLRALDGLKRLPEVVAGNGKQQGLEIGELLWFRNCCHAPADRSRRSSHRIEGACIRCGPKMPIHVAHCVSPCRTSPFANNRMEGTDPYPK